MGFDKEKIKQIRWLMVLGALLILSLIYSKLVFAGVALGFGILKPFLIGGTIAFVLNLPMKGIENGIFKKWNGKLAEKIKRPVSMVMAIIFVLLIINLVFITVVPQISKTVTDLSRQVPVFVEDIIDELEKLSVKYPQLEDQVAKLENLEIDWKKVVDTTFDFLKSGVGSVLTSTVNVATSIIGGVVNLVISFIFALYILGQKEKLANQGKRIMTAFFPSRLCDKTFSVFSLLHRNFSNFITGQCLEAVILGTMFVITMSIFRMPYAVMIGVLIAFTALIPIVGAFIGCVVGAFLILINNPIQALWFIILFLILQQLEGNLIYPKVVGNSVGLPAIWVLMAVSLGGSLFGVAGMLFFIPLLSTVYSLLRDSVNDRNRRRRELPGGRNNGGRQYRNDSPGRGLAENNDPEGESGQRRNNRKPRNRNYNQNSENPRDLQRSYSQDRNSQDQNKQEHKQDRSKQDRSKQDQNKQDQNKQDQNKQDQNKQDQNKQERNGQDQIKQDKNQQSE